MINLGIVCHTETAVLLRESPSNLKVSELVMKMDCGVLSFSRAAVRADLTKGLALKNWLLWRVEERAWLSEKPYLLWKKLRKI